MALGGGSGGGGSANSIRMGGAHVELTAKDGITAHLKGIAGKFADFGKQVLALTGIGGLVGGILGGLSFKQTVDDLSKMNDVAKAFGVNGTRISGLFGVLGSVGGEFKENLEGVIQFSGQVEKAVQGVGTGKELFDGLAVTAKDIAGVPIDEQFYSVLGAIRKLPQPLQESKLALIGGTDSMKQWQRLLSMSNEEVRELAKNMAFSTAELEDAAKASRAMDRVSASVMRIWQQIVIMVSPFVADLANRISDGMKPIVEWLRGRTLADIWEEVKARFDAGWTWISTTAMDVFADVFSFFQEGWNKAILGAKFLFADLGVHISKVLSQALRGPLLVLSALDPRLAAVLGAGLNGGNAQADAEAAKRKALAEFKANETVRDLLNQAQHAQGADERSFAENRLWAALDQIERNKAGRLDDPDVLNMRKNLASAGKAMGTFGAGAFLTQGFGSQSASPAKQTVDQLKKVNEKLGDIFDKLDSADPLLIV